MIISRNRDKAVSKRFDNDKQNNGKRSNTYEGRIRVHDESRTGQEKKKSVVDYSYMCFYLYELISVNCMSVDSAQSARVKSVSNCAIW